MNIGRIGVVVAVVGMSECIFLGVVMLVWVYRIVVGVRRERRLVIILCRSLCDLCCEVV